MPSTTFLPSAPALPLPLPASVSFRTWQLAGRHAQNRVPGSALAQIKEVRASLGSGLDGEWPFVLSILLHARRAMERSWSRQDAWNSSAILLPSSRLGSVWTFGGPIMSARDKGILTKDSVSLLPCFYFVEVGSCCFSDMARKQYYSAKHPDKPQLVNNAALVCRSTWVQTIKALQLHSTKYLYIWFSRLKYIQSKQSPYYMHTVKMGLEEYIDENCCFPIIIWLRVLYFSWSRKFIHICSLHSNYIWSLSVSCSDTHTHLSCSFEATYWIMNSFMCKSSSPKGCV